MQVTNHSNSKRKMKEVVVPGISTKELDEIAMKIIKENRAIPTFLGYSGFPACSLPQVRAGLCR